MRAPSGTLIAACVAATWFIWGSTYLAIKFALVSFPPFLQMGTRFLVAGFVLLAWARARRSTMPTRRQWRHAAIVGSLMMGNMAGAAYAEQTVASGLVVAFAAVTPALITIGRMPFGVRPTRLETAGMLVGIVGALLLIRGAGFATSPAGLIAVTAAVLAWSTGSVLSQHVYPLAPAASGFASQMICGGAFLMLISLVAGETVTWPPQALAAASWAYLVTFGSLVVIPAYMVLLANTSAVLASSYCFVNPVIGMLLGVWLGAESVTRNEWFAVAVIVAGVTGIVLGRRSAVAAPAPSSSPLTSSPRPPSQRPPSQRP